MRMFATLAALLVGAGLASAKPAHLKAVADYVGPTMAKKLNQCQLCHLEGGDESEKPHNDFGKRLAEWRAERKKSKANNDIATALDALGDADADKDGFPNLVEILTGHFPGDLKDVPTAAEKADGVKKLAALRASRADYVWQPFEPVQRPTVPKVKNAPWVRNPIDAFIAEQHEKNGLTPRPEAPKAVLLRRVYLDLVGLPPTAEQLNAFLQDSSPNAYEKVVDELLRSPQYGVAQARHWMDVWRYSDWAGYGNEVRDSQPHIWRWRDWIVESLNADKSYPRMVQEMLAADELVPEDEQALRATGFLVRNWYKFNREIWLDRAVEHTGKAFLGLTINCSRCHDHMYDPIPQTDYYAFRAFFAPHDIRTDRLPGQADPTKDGLVRVYDANAAAPTYLFVRGNDADPDKSKSIPPAVPSSLRGATLTINPVNLPPLAITPENRAFVLEETRLAHQRAVQTARHAASQADAKLGTVLLGSSPWSVLVRVPLVELRAEQRTLAHADIEVAERKLAVLEAQLAVERIAKDQAEAWKAAATKVAQGQRELAVADAQRTVAVAQLARWQPIPKGQPDAAAKRKNAADLLAKAEAALKMPPTTTFTPRPVKSYPATSTGRRLALANWIADTQNPLTARVAINHLWLRRFGSAIVPTVFDFGKNGLPPTHPKLLDWLAAELVAKKGSLKELHRLMVLSATYRMDSNPLADNIARDPDNRWLWRQNVRRMTAEMVRDSVLSVAGELDVTHGGVELDHNAGMTIKRRSLYFRHAPEKQMVFLEVFDAASPTECYKRSESVVPQQALALANSPLTQAQSRALAKKLATRASDDAAFITLAFATVLNRSATPAEHDTCQSFLREQTTLLKGKLTPVGGPSSGIAPAADPHARARESLIHVLLNHNDFVSVR